MHRGGANVTLGREEIVPGLLGEVDAFVALLGTIDQAAWETPSRCDGWRVADVAGHAVGSLTDVVSGRTDGLGSPEVTAREVAERSGRTAGELADELVQTRKQAADILALFDDTTWAGPAPGGYDGTLGQGVEAIWYDTWAHADDICAALGREWNRGPGLRAAVHHVAAVLTTQGWGPATLALDGLDEVDVGAGGRRITGDPLAFVLAASGRTDPAALGLDPTVNIYRL
jgi:uncharacterized protein (TIGR03083 family)